MGGHRFTRRVPEVALAIIAMCASAAAAGTRVASAAPSAPGFGEPTPSGIQGNGFEQDVRLDPNLASNGIDPAYIYTSAPQTESSTISVIWRSADGGQTFKEVPAQIPPGGKLPTCAGGGDSELAVDSTGSLYFNDLTVANFSTARSDDHGATFAAAPSCAGVPQVGVDRQWYAVHGDPKNGGSLVLASDFIEQSNPGNCPNGATFINGNVLTFNLSPTPAGGSTAGEQFGPFQTVSCQEGIMGNDEVYDYGSSGGLKAFVIHDDANFGSILMGRCDVVGISVTNTTGFANCQDKTIYNAYDTSATQLTKSGANFPTMTVDSAGDLYAVWEQAPINSSGVTGNTLLYWSKSVDQGNTWTPEVQVPTPGLLNHVYAWAAAGDLGKVDVAFYGTTSPWATGDTTGADSINARWGLYMVQTLDSGASWSTPVEASEHDIHSGTIFTNTGGQTGSRALGDFLQMRIGPEGEANISYADSNDQDSFAVPQAMFVRQNSGPGVFNATPTVNRPAAPTGNCVTADPAAAADATFDSAGSVGSNNPNLDITGACMSQPDSTHYQVQMTVADLTSLTPGTSAGGTTLLWQTQWHVPSSSDANGGGFFFVYMESVAGQAPTCWTGQTADLRTGGGLQPTYPGVAQLTGSACSYTNTAPGTITITVPAAGVAEPGATGTTLYSVTASSQTLPSGNAETPPPQNSPTDGYTGGQLPNLIDVAPAFDFTPTCVGPPCDTPEAPLVPLLIAAGAAVAALGVRRQRRARTV